MMDRRKNVLAKWCMGIGIGFLGFAFVGCGGEDPDVAAPTVRRGASTPTMAEPVQSVIPVAELMDQLGIDDRIVWDEEKATSSTPARKAILGFFDAFSRGDYQSVSDMLPQTDRYELDRLVESGAWSKSTDQITEVLIETGDSPEGIECVLAIFEVGDTYQPQLWYFSEEGDHYVFDAVSTPPDIMNRLYGLDPIDVWHQILQEETDLASLLDEDVNPLQIVLDGRPSRGGNSGGLSGDGPGMRPSRTPPTPIPAPSRSVPAPTGRPGGF